MRSKSGAQASVDYEYLINSADTTMTTPATPTSVTASSQSDSTRLPINVVNNSGMSGAQYPNDRHGTAVGDMWMTSSTDTTRTFIIDLGRVYPLGKMLVWNYNELTTPSRLQGLQHPLFSDGSLLDPNWPVRERGDNSSWPRSPRTEPIPRQPTKQMAPMPRSTSRGSPRATSGSPP